MSGWPSLDRVDDERLARSLAAGNDPGTLIQIMDRYAARLYDYCHALLRDQESAAGALHDALVAACAHVCLLREPDRFRGWLYALARNECMRRLHDPDRPAERHEAPEVEETFLDEDERAHRFETRRLVHGALSELRGREREALDLMLRHGLDAVEIAGVLGTDVQEATDLTGQARARLDDALAAAFIARTGRDDCPAVAGLVDGDGGRPLTPEVSRRLVQHIEACPICTGRRDRTVSAARLLQVLPVALMPTDLRGRVLVTTTDPAFGADLAAIAQQAQPFDAWGWPMPVGHAAPGDGGRPRTPPRLWPALAAAAAVILVVAGAFFLMPDSSQSSAGAQSTPSAESSAADPSESATDSPEPSKTPTPTPTTTTPTPTPARTTATATPTPRSSRRTPSRSPRATQTSRQPASGTLSVSGGCSIKGSGSCPITVTAVNGPVTWSVTGASGGVSASGGGRLARGASRTVQATHDCSTADTSGNGSVTFSPKGSASVHWSCPGGNDDNGTKPAGN